ncbi:hypothetical protein [Gaoshiqia sp. Z1-71]|uniref:hypothetical protein n=1 Tax=Gaoshiqia hydrogeniformans TaxID=3290090 RepID=UPI003BF82502
MIDLNELEKRLDEALAKETSESLCSWILNQRKDNLESFLGAGCFTQYKGNPYSFNMDLPKHTEYNCTNENNPCEQLAKAA